MARKARRYGIPAPPDKEGWLTIHCRECGAIPGEPYEKQRGGQALEGGSGPIKPHHDRRSSWTRSLEAKIEQCIEEVETAKKQEGEKSELTKRQKAALRSHKGLAAITDIFFGSSGMREAFARAEEINNNEDPLWAKACYRASAHPEEERIMDHAEVWGVYVRRTEAYYPRRGRK